MIPGQLAEYCYRDSGIEWLEQIPSHWEAWKIGHLLQLGSGETLSAEHINTDGGFPVYGGNGLRGFFTKHNHSGSYILIGRQGALCGNINYAAGDFWATEHALVVYPQRELNIRWLGETLRHMDLNQYSVAAAQPGLSVPNITCLRIPVPPSEEQTQIAKFLDYETARIDALIEKQEQLIGLLKEKRQAVISHAVTKGLNPDAPMRDSGVEWLGEVPAHWAEYPLKALFGLKHGYAFDGAAFSSSGKYILMTPGNFEQRGGFRHQSSEKFYTGDDIPQDYILEPGQLLVAMTEQGPGLLGCPLFVPDHGDYLHNQRLGLVQQLPSEKASLRFLFHLFNSNRYRAEISVTATGAKVQHTSPKKILSVKVWLPSVAHQDLIANFIEEQLAKFDALETKARQTSELLKERRTALISAAVTGKIDVRNWQPPAQAKAEVA